MARPDRAATAQRLFEGFLAPLILGGDLTPGPAIGPRMALSLGDTEVALDPALRTEVEVARVRVARQLVAIDVVDVPTASEWALAAALHDLVHALHPGLDAIFRRSAPTKLLDGVEAILDRVAPAASLAEVVSRHTLFARMFELRRTDTTVSWWVGSQTFLGTAPPARLLAWPQVRNVRTDEAVSSLTQLPTTAKHVSRERFLTELSHLLHQLPLTDLATAGRDAPGFAWTGATLGLLTTPGGHALGLRALSLGPLAAVDGALGRATMRAVKAAAWEIAGLAARVLGDRMLAGALSEVKPLDRDGELSPDAAYARTLGAIDATARLPGLGLRAEAARAARAELEPYLRSPLGAELRALHFLPPPGGDLAKATGSVGGSSMSIEP